MSLFVFIFELKHVVYKLIETLCIFFRIKSYKIESIHIDTSFYHWKKFISNRNKLYVSILLQLIERCQFLPLIKKYQFSSPIERYQFPSLIERYQLPSLIEKYQLPSEFTKICRILQKLSSYNNTHMHYLQNLQKYVAYYKNCCYTTTPISTTYKECSINKIYKYKNKFQNTSSTKICSSLWRINLGWRRQS